jgi:fibronectin-binding autotransporter adhesin
VNYNGGAAVTWGSNFAMTGQSLLLSSASSDSKVTLANAIDLGGAVRTVTTADGGAAIDAELSGALSNGGITISGAGTILLSGANTYSGVTTVNGGNLEIASTLGSTAASSLVILNGTLRSTGTGGSTNQLFQIGNSNTADVSATLDSSGSGAIEFSNTGSILYGNPNRTRQFNFTGTNTGDNIFRSSIGNNGTSAVRVNKDGTGKWILSGSNSYTDVTYIYEGTLSIASNWALGNTSSVNMLSGATLDLDNVNTGSRLFYLSGSGVNGGGSLTVAGTSTISGTIRLDSSVDLVIGGAGTLNLNAYVREIFGGSVLTKVGSGTLVVSNPGTPDGLEYQINEGTVLLNSTNITSISGTLATINNGATLRIIGGNGNQINNYSGVRVNSGGLFDLNSRNEAIALLLGSGTVTNTALGTTSTLTIGDPDWNPDSIFSGQLQDGAGAVALVKTGTGSFTLSGSNGYTGGTTVNGGILVRGSANAFVNNTAYTVNGGTMALNNYDLTASSFRGTGGAVSLGSANLTVNQSANTTYAGRIFGTGGLAKQGTGTLTLSGSNAYTGGTTLAGGVLALGSAHALGSEGSITFQGGILRYSSANTNDYSARFSNATNQAYRIDTNGQDVTLASGLSSLGGSFEKFGTGTLTLTGANSYTGATTVHEGKLIVDGDNSAATGDIAVEDTATLGGSGTIGGNTIIQQGGILSPGSSPGTLTFANNLTMEDGAVLFFEAGDLVDVGGQLTLEENWTLAFSEGFQDGGSVVLFTYDSFSSTGLAPFIDIAGLGFTPSGPLSLTDTGSSIVLNGISVVPEPSTLLLLAGAGVMLAAKRRRYGRR